MARGGGHINGDSIYILFRMRKGRSNLARGGGHIHGDSMYILFRMAILIGIPFIFSLQ